MEENQGGFYFFFLSLLPNVPQRCFSCMVGVGFLFFIFFFFDDVTQHELCSWPVDVQ